MKTRYLVIIGFLILIAFVFYASYSDISNTARSHQTAISNQGFGGERVAGVVIINDSALGKASFAIGGPVQHDNLQIFPIIGKYGITEKDYTSLGVAMEKEMVIVHETSDVNELSLTNKSDKYIFINSGDIVKGGKQDRTIQYDVIIPPREKKVPLASFCVERGRWRQRANESTDGFASSEYNISSRDLKVSAKKDKNQGKVWQKVSSQQNKLMANMSVIKDTTFMFENESQTSLQLTLEDKDLTEIRRAYKDAFASLENKAEIIGFAYAINGEVYGIDIFNNRVFTELRSKLVDGFITEAIADIDSTLKDRHASIEDVNSLLQKPETASDHSQLDKVNSETLFAMQVYGTINRFTTFDKKEDSWLHLNVIRESEESAKENNEIELPEDRFYNGR